MEIYLGTSILNELTMVDGLGVRSIGLLMSDVNTELVVVGSDLDKVHWVVNGGFTWGCEHWTFTATGGFGLGPPGC